MKIKVAKTAGFCWGVRRAIDKVLTLRQEMTGPIQTFGPLIHNPHALRTLEQQGISAADSFDELNTPTVVIRTHGVSPQVRRELNKRADKICDGTCPRVGHIQSLIKRSVRAGKQVVIAGDRGHAEVAGLIGYAGDSGYLVSTDDDVAELPDLSEVVLVAQTTFGRTEYAAIAKAIQKRFPDADVFDTICDSTHSRQAEIEELARESDAVIVIGGRESANTRRLAELAASLRTPTYLIESDEELNPEMFDGVETVGVSAGASTPHWMIKRVIERLESIGRRRRATLPSLFGRFLIASNLYVSFGAGLLCLLTTALLGIEPIPQYGIIAGCYIFSMHLLSHFADRGAVGHNEPLRYRLYTRFRRTMIAAGCLSAAVALTLAFLLGAAPGSLVLLATLMGILYSVRIIPERLKRSLRIRRLKDVPSSKDVFVGIAWSVVTVLVPTLHAGLPLMSMVVLTPLLGVFALAYVRSVLFDIREIGGDRLVGKESLPTVLGSSSSQILLAVIVVAASTWFFVSSVTGLAPASGLLLVPLLLYFGLLLLAFRIYAPPLPSTHARDDNWQPARRLTGLATETLIDSVFILAGILGAIWVSI